MAYEDELATLETKASRKRQSDMIEQWMRSCENEVSFTFTFYYIHKYTIRVLT